MRNDKGVRDVLPGRGEGGGCWERGMHFRLAGTRHCGSLLLALAGAAYHNLTWRSACSYQHCCAADVTYPVSVSVSVPVSVPLPVSRVPAPPAPRHPLPLRPCVACCVVLHGSVCGMAPCVLAGARFVINFQCPRIHTKPTKTHTHTHTS